MDPNNHTPRTNEEIRAEFQQTTYEYGWLDYRIESSIKQKQALSLKIENLLAENEARVKLDKEAADKAATDAPATTTAEAAAQVASGATV